MQLGVAFCGEDTACHTAEVFSQFRRYHISPHGFVTTGPLLFPLLTGILPECPKNITDAKKYLKKQHITRLSHLPFPILICEKNLLTNQPLYTGKLSYEYLRLTRETDQELSALLARFRKKFPIQFRSCLITDRAIKEQHLLLGLNLIGSQKYLIVSMNSGKEGFYPHNPHCATLCIPSTDIEGFFEKHILALYEFLYFRKS